MADFALLMVETFTNEYEQEVVMAHDDEITPIGPPKKRGPRMEIKTDSPGILLEAMEEDLRTRIFGQDRAVRHVVRALSLSEAGIIQPGKPIGIFALDGPPGVGKTQMAYEVAMRWLGITINRDVDGHVFEPLTKIDCTDFTSPHDITNLTGAKKMYVGYGEDLPLHQHVLDYPHFQQLLSRDAGYLQKFRDLFKKYQKRHDDAVADEPRKQADIWYWAEHKKISDDFRKLHAPFKKVLLFDEFDSAHKSLQKLIVTIANGRPIKLSDGKKTSFENTLIFLTSNIAHEKIRDLFSEAHGDGERVGFRERSTEKGSAVLSKEDQEKLDTKIYRAASREVAKIFSDALMSRLRDNILVFRPLSLDIREKIVGGKLLDIQKMFAGIPVLDRSVMDWHLFISFTPAFRRFILEEGTHSRYGARDLEQVIKRHVEVSIANAINSGEVMPEENIQFDIEETPDAKFPERTHKKPKVFKFDSKPTL